MYSRLFCSLPCAINKSSSYFQVGKVVFADPVFMTQRGDVFLEVPTSCPPRLSNLIVQFVQRSPAPSRLDIKHGPSPGAWTGGLALQSRGGPDHGRSRPVRMGSYVPEPARGILKGWCCRCSARHAVCRDLAPNE